MPSLQEWESIAIIAGTILTAGLLAVAVWSYLRSRLAQKADALRDLLFECQQSFRRVYLEYNRGLVANVSQRIFEQKAMERFVRGLWNHRNDSEAGLGKFLDDNNANLTNAILDAVVPMSTEGESGARFRLAFEKIRPRYPILGIFLRAIQAPMSGVLEPPLKAENYLKLIPSIIRAGHKSNILQKQADPEDLQTLLRWEVVSAFQREARENRLDSLLRILHEMLQSISRHYAALSDFRLAWLRFTETEGKASVLRSDSVSKDLAAFVNYKRAQFKDEEFWELAQLVGQARAYLEEQARGN